MAQVALNTAVVAANVDTIVIINGVRNKMKEFVRAGAVRMIGNQFIYVGGEDMVGSLRAPTETEEILARGYPQRANNNVERPTGYNEVQVNGEWMLTSEAYRRGFLP